MNLFEESGILGSNANLLRNCAIESNMIIPESPAVFVCKEYHPLDLTLFKQSHAKIAFPLLLLKSIEGVYRGTELVSHETHAVFVYRSTIRKTAQSKGLELGAHDVRHAPKHFHPESLVQTVIKEYAARADFQFLDEYSFHAIKNLRQMQRMAHRTNNVV